MTSPFPEGGGGGVAKRQCTQPSPHFPEEARRGGWFLIEVGRGGGEGRVARGGGVERKGAEGGVYSTMPDMAVYTVHSVLPPAGSCS